MANAVVEPVPSPSRIPSSTRAAAASPAARLASSASDVSGGAADVSGIERTQGAGVATGSYPRAGLPRPRDPAAPPYAAAAGAGSYASTGLSHRSTVSIGTPFRPA